MKFRHFASAIAALALAGCSNDDVVLDNNPTNESSAAYMKVNIGFANGFSSRGTSGGFQQSLDEHTIKHADFYFYAEDGSYYTKTSMNNGITDKDESETTGNIETKAQPVIVIEKTTNKLPGYLLVVLNNATEDLSNKTLAEAATTIGTWDVSSTENGFIMTNSTYDGTKKSAESNNTESNNKYFTNEAGKYFATPVTATDFHTSKDAAKKAENAVDIYVERLAAKVSLSLDQGINASNTNITVETADETNNNTISIKVTGWALNGIEKNSYLMKNINTNWAETGDNVISVANWNDVNNRRSNWANSATIYNNVTDTYPMSYQNALEATEANMVGYKNDVTGNDQYDVTGYGLDYVSYDELNNTVGSNVFEYCRENTLSTSRLENNLLNSATSVLIAAEIVQEGENKDDYFLYGGTLYKTKDMKAQIVSMYSTDLDDYFVKDENGNTDISGTKYRSLNEDDIEFYSPYDGYIAIALTETAKGLTWGKITDNNGTKTFTELTKNEESSLTELDEEINGISESLLAAKIQGFKEGKMYYNIPIEHLGTFNKDNEQKEIKYNHADYKNEDGTRNIIEGQYGVVRNHIYNVTVNNIKNLGRGVYNPSEDIIPNVQDAELYYLAAEIKVLSWHIVNQEADL